MAPPDEDGALSKTYRFQVSPPNIGKMVKTIKEWFQFRRSDNDLAYVEEQSGSIKAPTINYPENFLARRLKILLDLQKQREEAAAKKKADAAKAARKKYKHKYRRNWQFL